MRTVIHTGMVETVAESNRRSRLFSFASPVFSLGGPGTYFYVLGGWSYKPFSAGDFIAVAGRRTFMLGVQFAELAYRNVGVGGSAYGLGNLLPMFLMLAGLLAGYFAYLGALSDPIGRRVFIPMLVLGFLGAYRIVKIRLAVSQLNRMEMPLTTEWTGAGRDKVPVAICSPPTGYSQR
jgi:hypothetical protein